MKINFEFRPSLFIRIFKRLKKDLKKMIKVTFGKLFGPLYSESGSGYTIFFWGERDRVHFDLIDSKNCQPYTGGTFKDEDLIKLKQFVDAEYDLLLGRKENEMV